MHGEEFIADNMIKEGYAVISVDWRSADRSRYSLKEISSLFVFFFFVFFFLFLFFFIFFLINFRGTCIISFYYKTKYLFIHL